MSPNLNRSPVHRLMEFGCFFFLKCDTGQTNQIQGIIRLLLMMSALWYSGLFVESLHSSQLPRGFILQASMLLSVHQQLKQKKSLICAFKEELKTSRQNFKVFKKHFKWWQTNRNVKWRFNFVLCTFWCFSGLRDKRCELSKMGLITAPVHYAVLFRGQRAGF